MLKVSQFWPPSLVLYCACGNYFCFLHRTLSSKVALADSVCSTQPHTFIWESPVTCFGTCLWVSTEGDSPKQVTGLSQKNVWGWVLQTPSARESCSRAWPERYQGLLKLNRPRFGLPLLLFLSPPWGFRALHLQIASNSSQVSSDLMKFSSTKYPIDHRLS